MSANESVALAILVFAPFVIGLIAFINHQANKLKDRRAQKSSKRAYRRLKNATKG